MCTLKNQSFISTNTKTAIFIFKIIDYIINYKHFLLFSVYVKV